MAKSELVGALARTLESLIAQIAKLPSRIEHAVAELPKGHIVMSFPRAAKSAPRRSQLNWANVRARFQSELAAEAGVAPVTYQSGRSRGVGWRWACNKRLRAAVTSFADNPRHASPWAALVYRKARERGCKQAHAVRILARAWLRILWRAWQDRTTNDPEKHPAARALAVGG